MKAYIGLKRVNGKYRYGLTLYSERGSVLHSSVIHDEIAENKFENHLKLLSWAIKKIKVLSQNKQISDEEIIYLMIPSKTLYGWLDVEVAPEPYTVMLSDIQLEMSFSLNPLEIIWSQYAGKQVVYKNSGGDSTFRVTDLLLSQ